VRKSGLGSFLVTITVTQNLVSIVFASSTASSGASLKSLDAAELAARNFGQTGTSQSTSVLGQAQPAPKCFLNKKLCDNASDDQPALATLYPRDKA
jgi:hypothetical protein